MLITDTLHPPLNRSILQQRRQNRCAPSNRLCPCRSIADLLTLLSLSLTSKNAIYRQHWSRSIYQSIVFNRQKSTKTIHLVRRLIVDRSSKSAHNRRRSVRWYCNHSHRIRYSHRVLYVDSICGVGSLVGRLNYRRVHLNLFIYIVNKSKIAITYDQQVSNQPNS